VDADVDNARHDMAVVAQLLLIHQSSLNQQRLREVGLMKIVVMKIEWLLERKEHLSPQLIHSYILHSFNTHD